MRRIESRAGRRAARLLLLLIFAAPTAAQESAPTSRPRENRLGAERSLYLKLHATNPVDWFPWGAEAFERARRENKPIFLSSGYASCHWCHVMARESFENAAIAAYLNEHFVCVKLDREERPDVDRIYIEACIRLNGSAGWPLTAFLTPDLRPFYVTTYLPPDDRFSEPGFLTVATAVAGLWERSRDDVVEAGAIYAEAFGLRHLPTSALKTLVAKLERETFDAVLAATSRPGAETEAEGESPSDVLRARLDRAREELSGRGAESRPATSLAAAADRLRDMEDVEAGGFGLQPKFPSVPNLLLLLRRAARADGVAALDARAIVARQLDAMSRGGIRDHLGGGWHRYAVDRRWRTPHFEKMLYDQALIALVLTEAKQAFGDARYETLARETLDFCLRDLRAKDGGFISSLDAESAGEEGSFYTWTREEVLLALKDRPDPRAFLLWAGFEADGYDPATRVTLCERTPFEDVGVVIGVSAAEAEKLARAAHAPLALARAARVAPRRVGGTIVGWNALLASAFARAGVAFGEPRYVAAAEELVAVLDRGALGEDGLYRRLADAGPHGPSGELSDQAFMADALIDLAEATLNPDYQKRAGALASRIAGAFGAEDGGLYDSTAPDLPWRTRETEDNAWPSGVGAAALAFTRLALATGGEKDLARARRVCDALRTAAAGSPSEHPTALTAIDLLEGPSARVAIEGDAKSGAALVREVRSAFRPFVVVAPTEGERSRAIVCIGEICLEPAEDAAALAERLKKSGF